MKNTIGIALINLGTPSAPTSEAVRAFLGDFLSDKRVIDLPRLLWLPILYGIVLRIRPKRVAKLYQNIWQKEGSPMRVIGEEQVKKITAMLHNQLELKNCQVRLAMRYGEPNLVTVLQDFSAQNLEKVIILPLFPQYSATTTAAVFDATAQFYAKQVHLPSLEFISNYSCDPLYIQALKNSVTTYWQQHGKPDKLVMSFHGIPKRYVEQGDPYTRQCENTAKALAKALQLTTDQWILTYQSRFGYAEWVKPYTDATLKQLAQQGINRVDVISPAFSADCLETLEELAITNHELFLEQGGKEYHYIPALNDAPDHIECLAKIIERCCIEREP